MNKKAAVSILGLILLAVLIFLALSYLHLSVKIVPDNSGQNTSIGGSAMNLWNEYLAQPVSNLFNNFVLPLVKSVVSKILTGQPSTSP